MAKNIKIGFIVGSKRSNVFFNSAIFTIFIYAFWFAFVRRFFFFFFSVFIASVLFHASKPANYSSYSCFLCSKVITTQLQIQRWTQKIRQRIIIHRLTLNKRTESCIEMKNWAPNISNTEPNVQSAKIKLKYLRFVCVCTSPLAKNNKITHTLLPFGRASHEHTIFR